MKRLWILPVIVLLFLNNACKKDEVPEDPKPVDPPVDTIAFPYIDTVSLITLNVAGLPQGLSSGDPVHNTSEIGRRLNAYDIVNVQEDFNYNHFLYGTAKHKYKTKWHGPVPFGDGLNTLSNFKILDFQRQKWNQCNGADCLTPKGMSYSQIELIPGYTFDLYNIHANAGSDAKDMAARLSNLHQIYEYIATHSAGRPMIIMGDFNCRYTRDSVHMMFDLGLTDTWIEVMRNGDVPVLGADPFMDCTSATSPTCETVDKIFYRSSENFRITPLEFKKPREEFQRDGADLSDHIPVYTLFRFEILKK